MIKSRLMNQRPNAVTGEYPYKGVFDATITIFKKEGIKGFFRGFMAYYGRCAPHAMIILLSIESITSYYHNAIHKIGRRHHDGQGINLSVEA
jgi:solute carrier family 25 (mitochondrial oxoglutarate transporter), member 11